MDTAIAAIAAFALVLGTGATAQRTRQLIRGVDGWRALRLAILAAPEEALTAHCADETHDPCSLKALWRSDDGTFVDICDAAPLALGDARLAVRRYFEIRLVCPSPLPVGPPLVVKTILAR